MVWALLFFRPASAGAIADPVTDPVVSDLRDDVRNQALDVVLGAGSAPDLGATAERTGPLAVGLYLRPRMEIGLGDAVPDNNGGEGEPGLFTPAVAVGLAALAGPFELRATPWLRTGFVPGVAGRLDVRDVWAGVRLPNFTAGFGRQDRWLGPARHGSLTLTNNAIAPWLGTVAGEGHLPGALAPLGRLRGEVGLGLLGEPRGDVQKPGLLLVDVRWLPVPWIEVGATRLALFGGEGRPPVDVGQLLVPTEPHVYDDPDLTLPDQDELVALDLRVCLPLRHWSPTVPIDHLEVYWQYGGEDVISRKIGPIPYPSLAGVANLYGGELGVGPVRVNVEYSKLMDDTFRWYVGHRVYHDGFTQQGRTLGNFGGTDSEMLWARVGWRSPAWRTGLWADSVRRVGVIESRNDKVFVLSTEERRWRVGGDVGFPTPRRAALPSGWLALGYALEQVSGEDFAPGIAQFSHRGTVSWSADIAVPGVNRPAL